MKAKRVLAVLVALSFIMIAGYGRSVQPVDDSLTELAEKARKIGYNQAYIEIQYGINGTSEEDYSKYLEVKQRYEANNTLENLAVLEDLISQMCP